MWEAIAVAVVVVVVVAIVCKAYEVGYANGYKKGVFDQMKDCDERIKKIFNRIDSSSDDGFRVRDSENKPKLS